MLLTICTIRQLPQAFTLASRYVHYAADTNGSPAPVLIGLVDDPAHLPAGFSAPFPLLPISELLPSGELAGLSATYTPTEFAAACKPLFIREVFRRYPTEAHVLYADPNLLFVAPLAPVWTALAEATLLLTPHVTQSPDDTHWPDEKFFQNVGLYCADFMAFRRSSETDRLLAWWQDRVQTRAYINFCAGLCTDQIWLMHMPVFFPGVRVIKNPGWHVGLWNLPERSLTQRTGSDDWTVMSSSREQSLLSFINFKGLYNPDEGFFVHQNRLRLAKRPDVTTLLKTYRSLVATYQSETLVGVFPAYGQQPEVPVVRGWRRVTARSLRAVTRFVNQVPLPAIK